MKHYFYLKPYAKGLKGVVFFYCFLFFDVFKTLKKQPFLTSSDPWLKTIKEWISKTYIPNANMVSVTTTHIKPFFLVHGLTNLDFLTVQERKPRKYLFLCARAQLVLKKIALWEGANHFWSCLCGKSGNKGLLIGARGVSSCLIFWLLGVIFRKHKDISLGWRTEILPKELQATATHRSVPNAFSHELASTSRSLDLLLHGIKKRCGRWLRHLFKHPAVNACLLEEQNSQDSLQRTHVPSHRPIH